MHKRLLVLLVVLAVATATAVVCGVFASPANAWVHCYFGENLWGGYWYCISG